MFDVGFGEMIVIGTVALLVIGPERLPKVARTLGVLFGRLQRYVTQVKSDINREMEMAELGKVKSEFESAARSFQADIEGKAADVEREMREAQQTIERELADKSATATPEAASGGEALPTPSPQMELGIEAPAPQQAPPADRPAA